MSAPLNLFLAVPPTQLSQVQSLGLPLAHMAYRVGEGGCLLRSDIPVDLRGGLMVLSDSGWAENGDCASLPQQVVRECARRGFEGVLCDFDRPPAPPLGQFITHMGEQAARRGWRLFVPLSYAKFSPHARLLVPSALSGGSLEVRLQELAEQYGAQRLTLAIDRMAEDFFLPAPSGSGTPLSREVLARRIQQRQPSVFFSRELCAHYFTYMSRETGAHFVLFDDGASIREKFQLARRLGISDAVLVYPQVDDILSELL
jgi:hypothetical protein